jgi:hypothetical protein
MSTGSISDVLSRMTAIEQQMQQLENGSLPDFASALAQAQSADPTSAASSSMTTDTGTTLASLADSAPGPAGDTGSGLSSALGLSTGGVAIGGGAILPASASTLLTSGQQQFASTLAADTGLNPGVVTAWLLAEESGSAAQERQAAGNNDWLNVGYTDSGTYAGGDSVWSDPVTAANATAQWIQGQDSIPGYGTASSGVQSILSTVGQTPGAQVEAIQGSGWASGGYQNLMTLYDQVVG